MPTEADTPTSTKLADKARAVPALHPSFFSSAEYVRTVYCATIPALVEIDDLVSPEFWAHIASKLRPWDRIEAIAENGSYFAELLVLSATATDAQVVILNKRKIDFVQKGEADLLRDYEVSHTPATNWRVVRKTDRRTMKDGLSNRHDAVNWVATHKRAA
jgi:hypothetical protein